MSGNINVFPFPLHLPSIPTLYQYSSNSTLIKSITPTTLNPPFYYTSQHNITPYLSDVHLCILAPILAYWIVSLIFFTIDTLQIPYFESKRIHESPEVLSRNKVTVREVIIAVIFQQVGQIVLGLLALADEDVPSYNEHMSKISAIAPRVADFTLLVLGKKSGEDVLMRYGVKMVNWVYWWGIPAAQMMAAFFFLDAWQYWWHRIFHTYPYLYRKVHSVHHRLYVPYAFGALYNHPIEGFVLDTCGATFAHFLSGMSIRQATVFFAFSSSKTVDDHCGYRLWWDPLQFFFYNNVDYHDIHHQIYGLKANYSQPFFTNWDILLGTRMTREEANARTKKGLQKVE